MCIPRLPAVCSGHKDSFVVKPPVKQKDAGFFLARIHLTGYSYMTLLCSLCRYVSMCPIVPVCSGDWISAVLHSHTRMSIHSSQGVHIHIHLFDGEPDLALGSMIERLQSVWNMYCMCLC